MSCRLWRPANTVAGSYTARVKLSERVDVLGRRSQTRHAQTDWLVAKFPHVRSVRYRTPRDICWSCSSRKGVYSDRMIFIGSLRSAGPCDTEP